MLQAAATNCPFIPSFVPLLNSPRSESPFPVSKYTPVPLRLGSTKAFPGEVRLWHSLLKGVISDGLDDFDSTPTVTVHALTTDAAAECLLELLYHMAPDNAYQESSTHRPCGNFRLPVDVFSCNQSIVPMSFLLPFRSFQMFVPIF
jgi:hypothetical protein